MEERGEEDVGHSDQDVVLDAVVERIRQTLSYLGVVNVLRGDFVVNINLIMKIIMRK